MMDYMFELPSREEVSECIITKEVIQGSGAPKYLAAGGDEVPMLELKDSASVEAKSEESA